MATKQDINVLSGMRDFGPQEVRRREHIFNTLKSIFHKYGFEPIETPTIERLSVLSGKYGEEGDKLLFNVYNSGSLGEDALKPDKALRYDLTVPFARYVVNHRNDLTFPFKRYQIQPVWRGDRPQKGRYREFVQCDADMIGSESLLNEAELILVYHEAFTKLGIQGFKIKINNRKILNGFAQKMEAPDKFTDLCIAIDKWDKIGKAGVLKDLIAKGFDEFKAMDLLNLLETEAPLREKLQLTEEQLAYLPEGMKGIEELKEVLKYLEQFGNLPAELTLDLTLARGLDYYTGAIFEVTVEHSGIGSVGGGGRYDHLTDTFGLKNVTGVGISFGADRIYDVMLSQNLFEDIRSNSTQVLLVNFEPECLKSILSLAAELRKAGIAAEVYPQTIRKLDKQFSYADKKNIPYVFIIGSDEEQNQSVKVKDLTTGEQSVLLRSGIVEYITLQIKNSETA